MRRSLLFFTPFILILMLILISCDGWNVSPDDSDPSRVSEDRADTSTPSTDSENSFDPGVSISDDHDSKEPVGETSDNKEPRAGFTNTVYIKSANASELPSFESIYKFMPDKSCTASINNYDGFWPDSFYYYIKTDSEGNIEILYDGSMYGYKPDEVKFIIDTKGHVVFPTEYPSEVITEKAFNDIYEYHVIWNKEAYGDG